MANFKTHVAIAAAASTIAAAGAVYIQLISYDQTLWLIFLGTVGGLLPDIDANNSRPVRLLFNILAIISLLVVTKTLQYRYASYWVLSAAILGYFSVRFGAMALFNQFTEHRGVFHSILAATFFALLTTCVSYYCLQWDIVQCWLNGAFIAFGFIVHLLLDEFYSVDLTNRRIKKSFGTALKLWHYKNLTASLLLLSFTLILTWFAPNITPFRQIINLLEWRVITL